MGDLITVGDQSVLGDLKQLAKAIQDLGWTSPPPEGELFEQPIKTIENVVVLNQEVNKPEEDAAVYLHIITPIKKTHKGAFHFEMKGSAGYEQIGSPDAWRSYPFYWSAVADLDIWYAGSQFLDRKVYHDPMEVVGIWSDCIYFTESGSLALRLYFDHPRNYVKAFTSLSIIGGDRQYDPSDVIISLSNSRTL